MAWDTVGPRPRRNPALGTRFSLSRAVQQPVDHSISLTPQGQPFEPNQGTGSDIESESGDQTEGILITPRVNHSYNLRKRHLPTYRQGASGRKKRRIYALRRKPSD